MEEKGINVKEDGVGKVWEIGRVTGKEPRKRKVSKGQG
jgi:hypothetical protein